jgi:hypothetical protein
MKKTLLTLATLTALGLSSTSANAAFLDFTMDYGSVPGFPLSPYPVVADKLNGGYSEIINLTGTANPVNFNYTTNAFINLNQVFSNEGATLVGTFTGVGGEIISPAGFGMYALFTSTGTYNAGVFAGLTGLFDLYIDPSQDTANTFTAGGAFSLGGTGDDYQVAFATVMDYLVGNPGGAPAAYDTVFSDFTLTTGDQGSAALTQNGDLFFVAPRPFYLNLRSNGDFDQFITNYNGNPLQIFASGDVSAVFQEVPEPASLALLGLGMLGLGATRRKQA